MDADGVVTKTVDRIFLLRVSGKGDDSGNAGQLEVLKEYQDLADVAKFLDSFDVRMMKSSSRPGEQLRKQWSRSRGLRELTRAGRSDFLGVSVVIGRTRFICYASSAAKMDEKAGNAFTRHVCEAIEAPSFSGSADPIFMARRDAGRLGTEHPSVVYAFDPTRFCRSVTSATTMYDAAAINQVAFEAKNLFIDPSEGDHTKMLWIFLAYGSEMEATVGKQRRFVGRLNLARRGKWPYRQGMTPLGVTCVGEKGERALAVDEDHVASVSRLVRLGLDSGMSNRRILRVLGSEHGVISNDPKTLGMRVDELDPAAAKRLFLRRKLEAYRDGELALRFVGVMANAFRPGSGHVLTRRWMGVNRHNETDRFGEITYRIPMPKPTVTGPDGRSRSGWIEGVTDEQERGLWNRLILMRGVDDSGRRPTEQPHAEDWDCLNAAEQAALTAELQRAKMRATGRARGGRPATHVVSIICPPYRDSERTDDVPRTFLRTGSDGSRVALMREKQVYPDGMGLRRGDSTLLASFRASNLTKGVADLITEGVRRLTANGQGLAPHSLRLSAGLAEVATQADPGALRSREVSRLRDEAAEQLRMATGYDREVARERGSERPILARAQALEESARESWVSYQRLLAQADDLDATELPTAPSAQVPQLDFADPRDVVVGLSGVYATGKAPEGFLQALRTILPSGVRFIQGSDMLEWFLTGELVFATEAGETVTVTDIRVPVSSILGRGAGGRSAERAEAMAARRMIDGESIDTVAKAGGFKEPAQVARLISRHLNQNGRFPDPALLQLALDCPIAETTRILHEHAITEHPRPRGGFAAHAVSVYTQAPPAPSPRATRRTGQGRVWAYDVNVDHRLDQLTLVKAATACGGNPTSVAVAEMLTPASPHVRHVLTASSNTQRLGAQYPAVLRRLPAPGFPDGWYGKEAGPLSGEHKTMGLVQCPFSDCPEAYATALCPAVEVLALGAMVLCRQCRRAATPRNHPAFQESGDIRFPQAYIDWADAQKSRTGQIVPCAASGCARDFGFGSGRTWRWDDDPEDRAWHDAECRAGRITGSYTDCGYRNCQQDEGGGPGRIRQEGRGRRKWHARECEFAENLRTSAANVDYATCSWSACTINEGDGPGSIAKRGKHRTAHNADCHASTRNLKAQAHGETAAARQWAREGGIIVRSTGRLPRTVLDAYRARNEPEPASE
jgi:DNA invertase Pin-like site-specific DNA recombinase